MSQAKAAEVLGLSVRTLERWQRDSEAPPRRRHWRPWNSLLPEERAIIAEVPLAHGRALEGILELPKYLYPRSLSDRGLHEQGLGERAALKARCLEERRNFNLNGATTPAIDATQLA